MKIEKYLPVGWDFMTPSNTHSIECAPYNIKNFMCFLVRLGWGCSISTLLLLPIFATFNSKEVTHNFLWIHQTKSSLLAHEKFVFIARASALLRHPLTICCCQSQQYLNFTHFNITSLYKCPFLLVDSFLRVSHSFKSLESSAKIARSSRRRLTWKATKESNKKI